MSTAESQRSSLAEKRDATSDDDRTFLSDPARRVYDLSIEEWGEEEAIEMVGRSEPFLDVLSKTRKVCDYTEPVLITGESGVGKELLARAIYLLSERRGRPFVCLNCPQYWEGNLTVSELFGHEKGSFTGAIKTRKGAFEEAGRGVIFLDEIADLHPGAQAMLLRALAAGEYTPVGSSQTRKTHARVVAATNRAPHDLVVAKEFRNDLFFRLRYFLLRVPPLRDRGDDWRLILEWLLNDLRDRYGVAKDFSPASLEILEAYSWPGNVRELISIVTTGYAMADGVTIEPGDFSPQIEEMEDELGLTSESLYNRVAVHGEGFWETIYRPFMNRDLNRDQVKGLVQRGLAAADGSYQDLLDVFDIPDSQYQKFMDFLRHHDLKP